MLRNLVVGKKNITAYIVSIFVFMGNILAGCNPFIVAMLGALVEDKIPILIPFLIALRSDGY